MDSTHSHLSFKPLVSSCGPVIDSGGYFYWNVWGFATLQNRVGKPPNIAKKLNFKYEGIKNNRRASKPCLSSTLPKFWLFGQYLCHEIGGEREKTVQHRYFLLLPVSLKTH